MRKAADFEDFTVDEVRGSGAVGRNDEAALVAVERGEFFVGIIEDVEILQAGRTAHGVVLLDGDGEIHSGKPGDVAKRAAFVGRRERAGREAYGFDGVERKSAHGVDEIRDGVVVGKKGGVGGAEKEVVAFVDARFVAGVVEEERFDGVVGVAALVFDSGGEKLDEEIVAVGRPADGVGQVAEELVAAGVFLAFEDAAAFAARFLDPDVVVLEVVLFGFEVVVDGKGDAAVGSKREGGDFFVDGGGRLVEILGVGGGADRRANTEDAENTEGTEKRRKIPTLKLQGWGTRACAAAKDRAKQRAELAEPAEAAAEKRAGHGLAGAFDGD